jgi:hypothetical protein
MGEGELQKALVYAGLELELRGRQLVPGLGLRRALVRRRRLLDLCPGRKPFSMVKRERVTVCSSK